MIPSVTLLGMSGVGKTTLANKLPQSQWFHYSGDYRIATHYLRDAIGDFLKAEAMQNPILASLLREDAIDVQANLSVNNLAATSAYIGKLGHAQHGGLDLETFLIRQRQHRQAEIAACYDVGYFKQKAAQLYQYHYFIHDAGGSICELDAPEVIAYLAQETRLLYIEADAAHEKLLLERALAYPKPIYYQETFLRAQLDAYQTQTGLDVAQFVPNDFIAFSLPALLAHRTERYRQIAEQYGQIISVDDAAAIRDAQDFIELLGF